MKMLIGLLVSGLVGVGTTQAHASHSRYIPDRTEEQTGTPAHLSNVNFEGMVRFANCSGSLIRFRNSRTSDSALVLTNGHCVQQRANARTIGEMLIPHGSYRRNIAERQNVMILDRDANYAASLQTVELVYATMTGTDIAIYRLPVTYQQIERNYGIRARVLSNQAARAGLNIQIPSGYWQRSFECSVDRIVPELVEDEWQWGHSLRLSATGCEVYDNVSGSPIIERNSQEVVAILNTGNENGGRCSLENPCEVDGGQTLVLQRRNYGQQTAQIYSCLDNNGRFNLYLPGCTLTR